MRKFIITINQSIQSIDYGFIASFKKYLIFGLIFYWFVEIAVKWKCLAVPYCSNRFEYHLQVGSEYLYTDSDFYEYSEMQSK